MIDIRKVLSEHQIHYVEHGHNVARGNINIKCPMCGSDDRSEHMGIRLSDGYFGCWRNEKHRGKNLYKLLAILDIFIIEEKSGTLASLANRTFFSNKIEYKEKVFEGNKATKLPETFIPLDETVLSESYISYLKSRGFNDPFGVAKQYDLRRDYEAGKWHNRIILPISINQYVCWTGRAIGEDGFRYLSPLGEDTINIKDCIFNYNELKSIEGEILVITEGPFDAIKIDWYLRPKVRATCLFGLSFKDSQLKLLEEICFNFNNVLIGLDKGALPQSMNLAKRYKQFSPSIMQVPAKDFGEMEPKAINDTINKYI